MTLLDYSFDPEPNPLPATVSGQLTLGVSNGGRSLVTVTSITVTLPVGTNAKDLTASAAGIATQPPPGWRIDQSGGVFTLTPLSPGNGVVGRDGLSFIFAAIAVNAEVGTVEVRIDEDAALPSKEPVQSSTSLPLTKFPAEFTLSELTATPPEVSLGGSTTLMWSGSPATYTLLYDPDGQGLQTFPVSNSGPLPVDDLTNAAGVAFTLEVDVTVPPDPPLTVFRQCQVGVSLPKPVITSFTGTLSNVFTTDATAELTWVATGRDVTCQISGDADLLADSGSLVVPSATVARAASYTLTASNVNGSVSSELDIHWAPRVSATAVDAPLNIAIARDGSRAYVCCIQSLVAFDMTALAIVGSPTSFPQGLSAVNVSPDGTLLYLTSGDESTLTVLDAQTLAQVGAPIALVLGTGGQGLLAAAISPDGSRLFVPAGFGYPEVAVVDLAKGSQIATITVDAIPVAAAVSPDGTILLVSNGFAQSLSVIDTRTNQPIQPAIILPGEPKNCVFSPDGTSAYVAYFLSGATAAGILAIDVKTLSPIGSPVTIGDQDNGTFGLAVSPDGSYVLCGAVGKLYVLQTNPFQLLTTIDTGGADASDVQISPDGTVALVAAASANALVIVRLPSASGGVPA